MDEIISNHSDRLKMLLKELGLSSNALTKELGYKNNNTLSRIHTGKAQLNDTHINKIIEIFPNVNINFLKNGELPVLLDVNEQLIQSTLLSIRKDEANLIFHNIMMKLEIMHKDIREVKRKLNEKEQ